MNSELLRWAGARRSSLPLHSVVRLLLAIYKRGGSLILVVSEALQCGSRKHFGLEALLGVGADDDPHNIRILGFRSSSL